MELLITKTKFLSILLFSFIAGLAIIAVKMENNTKKQTLTMALSIEKSFAEMALDPANVQTLNQANLIRNLYSRLVEFNANGDLVTSAAESYEIKDGEVIFKIRSDLLSGSGRKITAEDFYNSFKRLLILDKNTHGDLKNLLCNSTGLHSASEACAGLRFDGDYFTVVPKDSSRIIYLLPMFASVDFSVLPKEAVNWNAQNLPIVNYQETSGAFFVEKDLDEAGRYILKGNRNSFLFTQEMPEEIIIYSADQEKAFSLFKEKKVAFLPTSYSWDERNLKELSSQEDVQTHESYPIKLWALRFTKPGFERVSVDLRILLGRIFRSQFKKIYPDESLTMSMQMFPRLSDGSLDAGKEKDLSDLFALQENRVKPHRVIMGIPKGELKLYAEALANYDWIEFKELVRPPWTLSIAEQPDFYLTFGDSSFFEDLSLISHQIQMGAFNLNKEEGAAWIEQYFAITDKKLRIEMLRDLHYNALKNAYVVPIGFTPFYAFTRKPWTMNFSKYYVGNPFWKISWAP